MSEIKKYRQFIKGYNSIGSYTDAAKVIDAYSKLDDLGSNELDNHLFEYARIGIANKYLRTALEDYLYLNENHFFRLAEYRSMFDVIDEYAEKVITEVKVDELLDKAITYKNQGNSEKAIRCYQEALELNPVDDEILKLLESVKKQSSLINLKDKYQRLVDELKNLASELTFPCRSYSLATERGLETHKNKYAIEESIIISIESPRNMDGYLTVIQYDDRSNLKMLFPHTASDKTFVKAGTEVHLGIKADEPIGKRFFKAIWTNTEIINPEKLNFKDDTDVAANTEKLLKSIYALNNGEWMESVTELEIVDNHI